MATQPKELDPKLRRLVQAGIDPDLLSQELANDTSAAADVAMGDPITPDLFTKRVLVRLVGNVVPASFQDLTWIEIVPGIHSVAVPILRLEDLAAQPEVEFIEAGRQMSPSLDTSLAETRADRVHHPAPPATGLDGSGVVVGIIDFGLDFTLDDFRNPDGTTRVAFLWDQFLDPQGSEQSPARFGHGVEYSRAQINAALQPGVNPFTKVRHDPGPGSHGTHVCGIAAANGRAADGTFAAAKFIGAAPKATIIFVQPSAAYATSSFTDSVHVTEAIAYVFEKAAELGLPCAINMSLGQNGGSHDGESLVERAIDRLLEQPGRAMVVAAGNEHIFRGHASGTLAAGESRALRWKVGGGLPLPGGGQLGTGSDFTPNELEIWYSSRDRFRVTLTSPAGESAPVVETGETATHTYATGDKAFIDSERFTVLNGDARIYIALSPGPSGKVSSGTWQVEIEAVEAREGRFDAWIERDARRGNNNFADQSFFAGPDFDPTMTLGTPATTRRGLAIANYDHVAEAVNDSSSRGRTRDGRTKPEVAAPGTNIVSCHSLGGRPNPAGGTFPVRVKMTGTSMAAPHVAGIAALLFQKNPRLTAAQTAKILIASAVPPAGVTPFDVGFGFGKVNAEAAVALVE
jgi:subtilisin family serine protease